MGPPCGRRRGPLSLIHILHEAVDIAGGGGEFHHGSVAEVVAAPDALHGPAVGGADGVHPFDAGHDHAVALEQPVAVVDVLVALDGLSLIHILGKKTPESPKIPLQLGCSVTQIRHFFKRTFFNLPLIFENNVKKATVWLHTAHKKTTKKTLRRKKRLLPDSNRCV